MDYLWEFGTKPILITVLCYALFHGTAGYAIASYGRYSKSLGAIIGVIFGFFGLAVLLPVSTLRALLRKHRRQREIAQHSVLELGGEPVKAIDSSGAFDGDVDVLGSESEPSPNGAMVMLGEAAMTYGTNVGEVLYPGNSSQVMLVVPPPTQVWRKSTTHKQAIAVGALATAFLAVSPVMGWFRVDAGVGTAIWLSPIGTGFDMSLYTSALLALLCVGVFTLVPSRAAAVLLASLSSFWLFVGLMIFSLQETMAGLLAQVNDFTFTVSNFIEVFGLDELDSHGNRVLEVGPVVLGDYTAIDLAGAIPDMALSVGLGVYALVGFALLAKVALILVLRAADQVSR